MSLTSLRAIQTDAVALQKAVASEAAAGHSLDITRRRLELGDINYLALLNAQQTYQQAAAQPRPGQGRPLRRHRGACSRRSAAAGGTGATLRRNGRCRSATFSSKPQSAVTPACGRQ